MKTYEKYKNELVAVLSESELAESYANYVLNEKTKDLYRLIAPHVDQLIIERLSTFREMLTEWGALKEYTPNSVLGPKDEY